MTRRNAQTIAMIDKNRDDVDSWIEKQVSKYFADE